MRIYDINYQSSTCTYICTESCVRKAESIDLCHNASTNHSVGICWFLSVRHVVDSFTWQNVSTPKGPSSVANHSVMPSKLILMSMYIHSTVLYAVPSYVAKTSVVID